MQRMSKARALKGNRRFAEFNKFLLAGFSGILFFVIDKIDCFGLKIFESFGCVLGIIFCGFAISGFTQKADRLEEEKELVTTTPGASLSRWLTEQIDVDSFDDYLYYAALSLLALVTVGMLLNPWMCSKEKESALQQNVINSSVIIQRTDSVISERKVVHPYCRSTCKKAIQNGSCKCKN